MHNVAGELADRQHGMVAAWQLLGFGCSRSSMSRRVLGREWRRLHNGVFFMGHGPLTFKAHFMAAALACGPEAVLSHHAAAALHDLRPIPQGAIDVTAPVRRSHDGI